MNAQAGGAGTDPFRKAEDEVRAMAAAPWWHASPPQQRAEAIASRMLSNGAEWWLFGAWGRWYRCGLDGHWHPAPPPAGPARQSAQPTIPGGGTPPVPPGLVPSGPDLRAGRVASAGLAGDPPSAGTVARLQQALITALSVSPHQFPLQDPSFTPGTPSTLAAAWGSLLWCAGTPVVLGDHPLIELFLPYLTVPKDRLRWMVTPGLSQLSAYYSERLMVGDGVAASHVARVMGEVAAALTDDPAFMPGAAALSAVSGHTLQLVHNDMGAVRYGPAAVAQEWQRRCPPEYALTVIRETAPGDHLRLALYDLTETVAAFGEGASAPSADLRRTVAAVAAADLQSVPQVLPAVLPWLDPEAGRTLQEVLANPGHPLRELWPRDGRLPDRLRSAEPRLLRDLLATSYAFALAWCRLAGLNPPVPGFAVPAAAAAELTDPAAGRSPTGDLTPWQIIDAARAHLASQREAAAVQETAIAPPIAPAPEASPVAEEPGALPDSFLDAFDAPAPQEPPTDPGATRLAPPVGNDRPAGPAVLPAGTAPHTPAHAAGPAVPPPALPSWEVTAPGPRPQPSAHAPEDAASGGAGAPSREAGRPAAPSGEAAAAATEPPTASPAAPAEPAQRRTAEPVIQPAQPLPAPPAAGRPAVWPAEPAPTIQPAQPLPASASAPAVTADRAWEAAGPAWPPSTPPAGAPTPAVQGRPADEAELAAPTRRQAPPPRPAGSDPAPPAMVPQPAHPIPAGAPVPAGPHVVTSFGVSFLCGPDDVGQMLTEVRRRALWARGLQEQEVSSASAPALVLLGGPSSGQRRVARMVARALAEAGVGTGRVHSLPAREVLDRGPAGLRGLLDEHAGQVVLLEDLDELLLDSPAAEALASALYRARTEGVSDTALVAACAPERFTAVAEAHPQLAADFRPVRLPDLSQPVTRVALLEVLAKERALGLDEPAWEVARRDMGRLRGRRGLTGARLIETYLDRAATRHFGQAEDTISSTGPGGLRLDPADFEGIAEDLEPWLRDVKDLTACRAELHSLVGLGAVKQAVERMAAEAQVAAARRQAGLPVPETTRHLAFAGERGTGKATVARLLAQIYATIGLLESGHVVECTPAELAGPGGAVAAVRARTGEALGGVLLVEGAAELGQPGARAVLSELARAMDERRDRLVVVCADRPAELRAMLAAVPALGRRLGEVVDFPTPSDEELAQLFLDFARRQQYMPDEALLSALPGRIRALRADPGFAAAGTVRRLFDDTLARQSLRIVRDGRAMSTGELTRLSAEDLPS